MIIPLVDGSVLTTEEFSSRSEANRFFVETVLDILEDKNWKHRHPYESLHEFKIRWNEWCVKGGWKGELVLIDVIFDNNPNSILSIFSYFKMY